MLFSTIVLASSVALVAADIPLSPRSALVILRGETLVGRSDDLTEIPCSDVGQKPCGDNCIENSYTCCPSGGGCAAGSYCSVSDGVPGCCNNGATCSGGGGIDFHSTVLSGGSPFTSSDYYDTLTFPTPIAPSYGYLPTSLATFSTPLNPTAPAPSLPAAQSSSASAVETSKVVEPTSMVASVPVGTGATGGVGAGAGAGATTLKSGVVPSVVVPVPIGTGAATTLKPGVLPSGSGSVPYQGGNGTVVSAKPSAVATGDAPGKAIPAAVAGLVGVLLAVLCA